MSVSCSIVVTCWERGDFLALLYVMFSCVFVTFPYGILGHVWYLIVSIAYLCLLPYFGLHWEIEVFPDHTHFFKSLFLFEGTGILSKLERINAN